MLRDLQSLDPQPATPVNFMTLSDRPASVRPLLLLLGIAVLAACAAPPDKYTAADIQQASSAGNLAELFDQIEADLNDPELSDTQKQTMQLRLAEAGRTLAQGAEKEIQASLESSTLASGVVPLNTLAAQQDRLEKIERWDAATYQRASGDVTASEKKTRETISAKETELAALADSQIEEKFALYDEIGALYGTGSEKQAEYQSRKLEQVRGLRDEASKAIENEDYSDAQRMLAIVQSVNPSDAAVEGKLVEVDAKLFEQRFYEALEKERPNDAYQALVTLSESPNFDKVRPRLTDSGDVMADYFVTLGAGATETKNFAEAFQYFMQSRDIRERLGLKARSTVPEEAPFIQEMEKRYQRASKKELHGLAWGYLNVIEQLQPDTPRLRRNLRETREKVLQKAVKRLSAARFEDHHRGGSEFGDTVTAKIVQYLFENLSEDVRIIEREKLQEIEKERGLSKDDRELIAVDYLIQGNILEAKVDSTERSLQQRKRVVTGRETIANPEWDRWNSMSDRERERAELVTQPPRTIEREKVEDVQIPTTYHRKVGVFSVSYRVIDAGTAKVLFADTQRTKRDLEGRDSPEVDMGAFKQEAQVANLPSDVEILDQLAEEVSETIGQKLAEVLVDPELQYQNDAERAVREGNYIEAAQQYAYAVVLSDRKQKDADALRDSLRTSSVSAALSD